MAVNTYGAPKRPTTRSNQNPYAKLENPGDAPWQNSASTFEITPNWNESQQPRNPYANQARQQPSNPWGTQEVKAAVPPGAIPTPPQSPTYTPTQMDPWQRQTPQSPTYTPYTPAQSQSWPNPNNAAGTPWDPSNFNTQALRDQYTAYMQATMPWLQFQQNNQQYAQDFNEAARRWDTQTQWQQSMDQYNMGLTGRQQDMAEWQQQEAARQWAAQFGHQQQNDAFSQDLANRQFGLEDRRLTGEQWYQGEQVRLAGQAQAIEQAYNEGRLSNEQRSIALAELAQEQDNAFRNLQLAEQMGWAREQQANELGFSREELAALQQYRQQQDALARWQTQQQLQQQLAMQQAQIAADRQNAVLAATGRAQGGGPNARWMARF